MPTNYNAEVRGDNLALVESKIDKIEETLRRIAKERSVDISTIAEKDGHPHIQEELEPFEAVVRILSELTPNKIEWEGSNSITIIDSRWQRAEGDHEKEQEVWRQIAPYVEAGSYIEIHDDEGMFRWVFTAEKLFMIKPGWPQPLPHQEVKAPE